MLRADALSIGYRRHVVGTGISVAVREGQALAILGPNGGGKTTLLKTLLGLLPPLGGAIRADGRELTSLTLRERAELMAYVPQVHSGTFGFTAREIVLMGRSTRGGVLGRPSAKDREAADAALERMGALALADRPYTEISGGERQLVLIARALAQEPKIVLLDEPTASLDLGNQGRVLRTIRMLADEGRAVLFTTHDPNHALRVADRVLMIRDGRVLAEGPSDATITARVLESLYGAPVDVVEEGRGRRLFGPK